jgi:hypothetical protein
MSVRNVHFAEAAEKRIFYLSLAILIAVAAFSVGLFPQETPESLKEIPRNHIRVEKVDARYRLSR